MSCSAGDCQVFITNSPLRQPTSCEVPGGRSDGGGSGNDEPDGRQAHADVVTSFCMVCRQSANLKRRNLAEMYKMQTISYYLFDAVAPHPQKNEYTYFMIDKPRAQDADSRGRASCANGVHSGAGRPGPTKLDRS